MKTNPSETRIKPTLGELMATVGGFAFEYSADTKEAYDLGRVVLLQLLKEASLEIETFDQPCSGTRLPH